MQPLKITGTINPRLDRSPERTDDTMFTVDLTVTTVEPETDADKFRNKSPMHKALLECEERCLDLEEECAQYEQRLADETGTRDVESLRAQNQSLKQQVARLQPDDAAIRMARRVIEEAVPVLENLYDYCKRDIPEAKAMHALSVLNNLRTAVRDLLAGKE